MLLFLKTLLSGGTDSLFRYLSKVRSVKMAIQCLLIVLTCAGLATVYVSTVHFESIFSQFSETPEQLQQQLISDIEKGIVINTILTDTLAQVLGASRIQVFKFHNGVKGVTNLPFLFRSSTNEVTNFGISSEIRNLQRVPLSMNLEEIRYYIRGKCYFYQVNSAKNGRNRKLFSYNDNLKKQGIKAIVGCPIHDKTYTLIGFIRLDFNDSYDKRDSIVKLKTVLNSAASRIKALL